MPAGCAALPERRTRGPPHAEAREIVFDFLEGYDLLGAFWVTVQLTLLVSPTELRLTADQTTFDPIPVERLNGRLDLAKLTAHFKRIRSDLPDQVAITVQPEDKVRYDDLVRIIDECIGAGLPQVSLAATTT